MKFSVLLLYPDYIADDFGSETWWGFFDCESPVDAIHEAQATLAEAHKEHEQCEPDDFYPLLVIHGWHDDVRG